MKRIISTLVLVAMVATAGVNAKEGNKMSKNNGDTKKYELMSVKFVNKTGSHKEIRRFLGTQELSSIQINPGTTHKEDLPTSRIEKIKLGANPDIIMIYFLSRDLKSSEMVRLDNHDKRNDERLIKVYDHDGKKVYRLQRNKEQSINLNPSTIGKIVIEDTPTHKNVVKIVTNTVRNERENTNMQQPMMTQQPMQQKPVRKNRMHTMHKQSAEQQLYADMPAQDQWVEEATETDVINP